MSTEYALQINNFNEFSRYLNLFAILQQSAQMRITGKGIEIFGKFTSGRCDLFSNSITLSQLITDDVPEGGIVVFFADLKKFIYTIGILGKYYDLSDNTPFLTDEISLFVARDASYIRIASRKYTIKYQLSTNAVVRSSLGDTTTVLPCSKYAMAAHTAFVNQKSVIDETQPLLAFKTGKKRIGNIAPLMATLTSSDNVMVKLEIPEQVAVETDLGGDGNDGKVFVMPNTLYAVISDTQRLMATKLGNKVCVEVGNITKLDADYKSHCKVDSLTENFVFLMTADQLKLISTLVSAFAPADAKPPKPARKKKSDIPEEPTVSQTSEDSGIEISISKVNLMHLNLISQANAATSEFYISIVGNKPE